MFPWPEISGRVARLAMNHILINEGYWPAIIHHVDRQRYYEALRQDQDELLNLAVSSQLEGVSATNRLYQGIVDATRRM